MTGCVDGLVLPYPHRQPTCVCESPIRIGVAESVHLDLVPPKVGVVFRPGCMLGASMPEAPVYEHCDPCRSEDDVCLAADSRYRSTMYAVSETSCVQGSAQLDFDRGVSLLLPAHSLSNARRRLEVRHDVALSHRVGRRSDHA